MRVGSAHPEAERVSLERSAVLQGLMLALIQCRLADEPFVTPEQLIDAVWSDERMATDSATDRLHQIVRRLRKAGLGELLVREPDGYTLDRATPMIVLG